MKWQLYEVRFYHNSGIFDSYEYDLKGEINYKEEAKEVLFDGTNWIVTVGELFEINRSDYEIKKGVGMIIDEVIGFELNNELLVTPML